MTDKNATSANDAKRKWNREYQRRWRATHLEQSRETLRKYQEKNRKKLNAKSREKNYKRAVGRWPTKWISVDEFLPDEGIPVLAYIKYTEEYFPGEDYGILTWDGETWSGGEWNDAPVTHWARLPEAPHEKV